MSPISHPFHIVLLGPPGAGKGTMGQRLALEFGLAYTSTGDHLRADPEWATEIAAGKLATSAHINALTGQLLTTDPRSRVWDGNLRLPEQATFFLDSLATLGQSLLFVADFQLYSVTMSWERVQRRAEQAIFAGKAPRREDVDHSVFTDRYQALVQAHQQVMAVLRQRMAGQIVPINANPAPELVYLQLKTAYRERGGPG